MEVLGTYTVAGDRSNWSRSNELIAEGNGKFFIFSREIVPNGVYGPTKWAYTLRDGVARWDSNDRCVPTDALKTYSIDQTPGFDPVAHEAARVADLDAFLAAYRAADPQLDSESMAEARAAHGPGVTLVNVITGRQFTT